MALTTSKTNSTVRGLGRTAARGQMFTAARIKLRIFRFSKSVTLRTLPTPGTIDFLIGRAECDHLEDPELACARRNVVHANTSVAWKVAFANRPVGQFQPV